MNPPFDRTIKSSIEKEFHEANGTKSTVVSMLLAIQYFRSSSAPTTWGE